MPLQHAKQIRRRMYLRPELLRQQSQSRSSGSVVSISLLQMQLLCPTSLKVHGLIRNYVRLGDITLKCRVGNLGERTQIGGGIRLRSASGSSLHCSVCFGYYFSPKNWALKARKRVAVGESSSGGIVVISSQTRILHASATVLQNVPPTGLLTLPLVRNLHVPPFSPFSAQTTERISQVESICIALGRIQNPVSC